MGPGLPSDISNVAQSREMMVDGGGGTEVEDSQQLFAGWGSLSLRLPFAQVSPEPLRLDVLPGQLAAFTFLRSVSVIPRASVFV